MNSQSFILGEEKIPDWFRGHLSSGKVKIVYNEEEPNKISNIIIYNPTGKLVANIGDCIMKVKSGFLIVPKEKVGKYVKAVDKKSNRETQG